MNEVSSKANALLLQMLEVSGVPPERLVEGLAESVSDLRDPSRRFAWDLHAELIERVAALLGGDEGLERAGGQVPAFPQMRAVAALAGSLLRPSRVYWMACRWLGPAHFSHIHYGFEELADGDLRIRVEIPPEHRPCPAFFHITLGTLRRGPLLLGMREEAEVRMDLDPDGRRALYRVRLPRRRGLWNALVGMLGLTSGADQAVEALAGQQRDLNRRYDELDRAERTLAEQGERLRTIRQLSRALLDQVEREGGTDNLLRVLREHFGWNGVALWLEPGSGGEPELLCAAGMPGGGRTRHPLRAGRRGVGHIDVWGLDATPRAGARVFEQLLPWLAMVLAKTPPSPQPGDRLEAFRWTGERERELFLIVDADGVIRYVGATAERILGVGPGAVLRRDIADWVHPDDLPQLMEMFTSFEERPGSAAFRAARLRHADGSWRTLEGVGIKVQDEQGRPVFMVTASDVTERARAH